MSAESAGPESAVMAYVDSMREELVAVRRDLHAHPELSWQERRTTVAIAQRLERAGVKAQALPWSGLTADVGGGARPAVALRADIDALPVTDATGDPWRSTVDGVAHACGHDLHTAALLGAGLALSRLQGVHALPGPVRLVFQPAEEVMPGGASHAITAGVLDGVAQMFALHCDPTLDVGHVGLRDGPITGATDAVTVTLSGSGGHTSRPHRTEDVTYALAKIVTELPAVLSRRLDPRSGVSVVWGMVHAGSAPNVVPATGQAAATVRMLDVGSWHHAQQLVTEIIADLMAPYGVTAEVGYVQGVPPVVNDLTATTMFAESARTVLGADGVASTTQSLGGEDFAWYLQSVPGAMARLGTRVPGGPTFDLHQGDLRLDERAVTIAAKLLAVTAIRALTTDSITNRWTFPER